MRDRGLAGADDVGSADLRHGAGDGNRADLGQGYLWLGCIPLRHDRRTAARARRLGRRRASRRSTPRSPGARLVVGRRRSRRRLGDPPACAAAGGRAPHRVRCARPARRQRASIPHQGPEPLRAGHTDRRDDRRRRRADAMGHSRALLRLSRHLAQCGRRRPGADRPLERGYRTGAGCGVDGIASTNAPPGRGLPPVARSGPLVDAGSSRGGCRARSRSPLLSSITRMLSPSSATATDVPGIGRFKSRFSLDELHEIDRNRGAEIGTEILPASRGGLYPRFLESASRAQHPFGREARLHINSRNRNLKLAGTAAISRGEADSHHPRSTGKPNTRAVFPDDSSQREGTFAGTPLSCSRRSVRHCRRVLQQGRAPPHHIRQSGAASRRNRGSNRPPARVGSNTRTITIRSCDPDRPQGDTFFEALSPAEGRKSASKKVLEPFPPGRITRLEPVDKRSPRRTRRRRCRPALQRPV